MDCNLPHSKVRVQPLQGAHLDQEGKHFLAGEDAVLVDVPLLKQGGSMCQGMLLQQSSSEVSAAHNWSSAESLCSSLDR